MLQQHLAKIHFWTKLLALLIEITTTQDVSYQYTELPCGYINKNILPCKVCGRKEVSTNIKCHICPEMVTLGEDYQTHLSNVHNIKQNTVTAAVRITMNKLFAPIVELCGDCTPLDCFTYHMSGS